jgi:hypothetical protein
MTAPLTASGSGSVAVLAWCRCAGETVNTAGTQAFLDKNVGTGNKVVRATRRDDQGQFGNADVTGNYAISYVDNTDQHDQPCCPDRHRPVGEPHL